ncbi:hypothetical protein HY493_05470 [Candidatus Woesearchaeota archaeon]|nr:hypothetical protein [Candidatus Woesearchaeota archaeon]
MALEIDIVELFEKHGLRVVQIEANTPLSICRQLPPVRQLAPDRSYAVVNANSPSPRIPLARVGDDQYLLLVYFSMTAGGIMLDFPRMSNAIPLKEFYDIVARMELR